MKFTAKMQANIVQGWAEYYMDYKALKKVIKQEIAMVSGTPAVQRPASGGIDEPLLQDEI